MLSKESAFVRRDVLMPHEPFADCRARRQECRPWAATPHVVADKQRVWWRLWPLVVLLVVLVMGSMALADEEMEAPEYRVKAAFLYNFTKLVEWPDDAFSDRESPLEIGILGKDPFGGELEGVLEGRQAQGRRLRVARYSAVEEATNCHVLFICRSEARQLDAILDRVKSRPVLTVGDSPDFANGGGIIELRHVGGRIGLRINLEASARAGLQLSSRLTRLDRTLTPPALESPTPAVPEPEGGP